MKAWIFACLAAVIGAAVGGGITWSEFHGYESRFPGEEKAPTDAVANGKLTKGHPKVVVEGADKRGSAYVHNFGVTEIGSSGKHVFVFRNTGDAPLTLKKGHFSCSCTVAELEGGAVPPGGAAEVTVEWTPKEYADVFSHGGDIVTNDPVHPSIRIEITGTVIPAVQAIPENLIFDNVTANESHTAVLTIYEYSGQELQVTGHSFDDPETAKYFDVAFRSLSKEELIDDPGGAKGGVETTVTLKPGLPLGPINQRIRLKLNLANPGELLVPIHGRIVGDFSFIGPKLESERNRLHLNTVTRGEGASRTIHVMIKGPHRRDVQLKVGRVSPEGSLQAKLGEPREINNGAVIMVPLEVSVPPDAPPGDYLGVQPGKIGEIVFETTHPEVKTVTLTVSFLVENAQ